MARKGWQRKEAMRALLSMWIRAGSFLPVQKLHSMSQKCAKPERIRMDK